MKNLWSENTPANFWQCDSSVAEAHWPDIIQGALQSSGLDGNQPDLDNLLEYILGEGQFGCNHWSLNTSKRLYYRIKWLVPRRLRSWVRSILKTAGQNDYPLGWPVEDRYVRFLWENMKCSLLTSGLESVHFKYFWPGSFEYALVLTHDIETGKGQSFVQAVADLEESLGFRSSFNFVLHDYTINLNLIDDLRERGFEVGLHGLKHDSSLFQSPATFSQKARELNSYFKSFEAVGFRSPLTLRHPYWMQALDMEYDLSFFDTDPWEPICGGTMTIWPFMIGHFVELPYTLAQDNTLVNILGETTPRLWLQKVEFIRRYHGMALVNTHPDYLRDKPVWKVYENFLKEMKTSGGYWNALPCEVARWWRRRSTDVEDSNRHLGVARLQEGELKIQTP